MRLAERDERVAALRRVMDACDQGTGSVVVISGGIGCGKTELLRTALRGAERAGFAVLSAVGSWVERHSPGGVLNQLLRDTDLPLPGEATKTSLLARMSGADSDGTAPTFDVDTTDALHQLCAGVLRRAEREPVLLCVDDVQFTDSLTLHWLLHLLDRARSARVVFVLTECTLSEPTHPQLHAELLRRPNYLRLALSRLSVHSVEAVLDEQLGVSAAERLAAECHRVSGGNPLLVRALAEDCRESVQWDEARGDLVVGDAYGDSVLSCLHRGRPLLMSLAQVLAVLDDSHDVAERATRVLDVLPTRVARAVVALESAGLVENGRLRHRVARQAVINSLSGRHRTELHRRLAELLYAEGAPATQVARHLLAVENSLPAWSVSLLHEAAERFLAENRAAEAHECVTAALRQCHDETERVVLKALLASVAWALNPSISARHLGELASALREGRLPERHGLMLVKYLLWHGRFDEAAVAFERISERASDLGPRDAAEIRATRELLGSTYPAFVARAPEEGLTGSRRPMRADLGWDPRSRGAAALSYILSHGPHGGAVAEAEAAMRAMRLTKHTQEWLACTVSALLFADRLEAAGTWCDHWLAESRHRNVPLWAAEFASLRASICVRQGAPARARQLAESALARVSAESWGVCLGGPLAHLVRACTVTGDYTAAAEYLDIPVPDGMYESRFGLYYLHARGRYQLETGRFDAALGDFLACGELMRGWGFDQPSLVPWRSEAALAHLALGDRRRALALARDQLSLAGERPTWARAVSLRAVAGAGPAEDRVALLTEAVEMLEGVGDRIELAGAFADLGRAHGEGGSPMRAVPLLDKGARLAEECGAVPLLRRVQEAGGRAGERAIAEAREAEVSQALSKLSGAERRVAKLAVRGATNREIAERLAITMSTVEQHLTRAFKKLGVRTRTELPVVSGLER